MTGLDSVPKSSSNIDLFFLRIVISIIIINNDSSGNGDIGEDFSKSRGG